MNTDALERTLDAGEYVLGTLAGDARALFQKTLAADAAARADVRWWEARLAALNASIKPETPRDIVWAHISFAAGLHKAASSSAAPRSVRVWQAMTSLATAASVLLGVALWQKTNEPPQILVQVQEKIIEQPAPVKYVGLLQVAGSDARWLVSLTPDRKALLAHTVGEYKPAAGKYLHLWWLNPNGPVSLGVVPNSGDAQAALPDNLDLDQGNGLAISLEDTNNVPTTAPFGAVLVAAPVLKSI